MAEEREEAKSATGCCNSWMQEAARQMEEVMKPYLFFFAGQYLGRETRHVAFCRPQESQQEMAKHFVGILNTNEGGTVFFGVSANGELAGLPSKDETRLKNDVEAVARSVSNIDHNFHHSLHFYRIYRYNMSRHETEDLAKVSLLPPRPLPPLTESVLAVLKISRCRAFPPEPYWSSLLDPTVTYLRRDGGCYPLSADFYCSPGRWELSHASLYRDEVQDEQVRYFKNLGRLKVAIFALSEKLVQYEKKMQ